MATCEKDVLFLKSIAIPWIMAVTTLERNPVAPPRPFPASSSITSPQERRPGFLLGAGPSRSELHQNSHGVHGSFSTRLRAHSNSPADYETSKLAANDSDSATAAQPVQPSRPVRVCTGPISQDGQSRRSPRPLRFHLLNGLEGSQSIGSAADTSTTHLSPACRWSSSFLRFHGGERNLHSQPAAAAATCRLTSATRNQ